LLIFKKLLLFCFIVAFFCFGTCTDFKQAAAAKQKISTSKKSQKERVKSLQSSKFTGISAKGMKKRKNCT